MEFCKINATCWVEIFFVFIFLFLTIVLLLGLAFRNSWHSLISDDGCQRKWSGLLADFLIVLHNAVHECYTLAIRVKEINKTKTCLFLFAVLSVRSRSFEELSALRSSVFNFLRWRLSVCPCLFIFLKYFFEFFTFHGERLEVWNLELEGTPEKAPLKFFLQRVEESMN